MEGRGREGGRKEIKLFVHSASKWPFGSIVLDHSDYKCTLLGFSAAWETSSVSLQKPLIWPTWWLPLPTPWDPPLLNPEKKKKKSMSVPRKPLFINSGEELMAKVFCFCPEGTQLWNELHNAPHKVAMSWSTNLPYSGQSERQPGQTFLYQFPYCFTPFSCITVLWDHIPK